MDVCVICDQVALGTRIRELLAASGKTCPADAILPIGQAGPYLAKARPDVVVVALGPDHEVALGTVSRLREVTTAPILAIGSVSDPRAVLRILRAGAADLVDENDLQTDLIDAISRARAPRDGSASPGRLLSVLAPSGGSGASLIAANLAVAMAKSHERTLLLDLKPRCGDLAAMLDLKPTHTIQDLCRVTNRIDRVLMEQTLAVHPTGVRLLASARGFGEGPITSEGLERIIELGRSQFPRVIADADPAITPESLGVLKVSDEILLVMRLEFNSLRNAKTLLDHLERQGIESKRVHLIANRKGQPKEIAAAKVEEALGRTFFAVIPDDPKAALGAQNNGEPVLKDYPSSWLSKAILKLATALDSLPTRPGPGR